MTTTTIERLALPQRRRQSDDPVAAEMARARKYGKNYYIMSWEDRSEDQQAILEERLRTFQKWRRRQGDLLPDDDNWELKPPSRILLALYIQKVSMCGDNYRYQIFAVLRLYLKYWERPDLFRLVERVK